VLILRQLPVAGANTGQGALPAHVLAQVTERASGQAGQEQA